ncbi:hypothetical protein AVEN_220981-1 [Araneus ventricosus]|uniref:Uncharacterized protein n=1 Tax=Araneus ventricosus TaxID=182803 RepID=A0A4Y2X9L4_ARAVE|nr:hypothetical protein AVEN_12936-1 [Araneus ventricosus]GBO45903.1 hypothetical protein AVEN_19112-1 [Araneus ventricosus]GBO45908.1 hypothetical protein AVEN_151776-1 [Araneus ventricosus]GBO45915.1 hypothetical protein AVEN_220981-1 [Araneus ventricosus]
MTRTTPELAPLLQTSMPHQREDFWPLRYDLACNRSHTRRIFSGSVSVLRTWNPPAPKLRPGHRGLVACPENLMSKVKMPLR